MFFTPVLNVIFFNHINLGLPITLEAVIGTLCSCTNSVLFQPLNYCCVRIRFAQFFGYYNSYACKALFIWLLLGMSEFCKMAEISGKEGRWVDSAVTQLVVALRAASLAKGMKQKDLWGLGSERLVPWNSITFHQEIRLGKQCNWVSNRGF